MRTTLLRALVTSSWFLLAGCPADDGSKLPPPVTATNHRWFPLGAGTTHELGKPTAEGVLACESCHRAAADSFTAVRCDQCHKHPEAITQRLHLGIPQIFNVDTRAVSDPDLKAELRGASCYGCHPTGEKRAFSHTLITNECAQCHAEGNAFAALPKPGFTHREVGTSDCGGCHVTTSWAAASAALVERLRPDPQPDGQRAAADLGGDLDRLGHRRSAGHLHDHEPPRPPRSTRACSAVCANCHAQADQGQYYPGVMHWSLTNLGVPQPATCSECHGGSAPTGFVGALDNRRSPSTGEMKHDAVVWSRQRADGHQGRHLGLPRVPPDPDRAHRRAAGPSRWAATTAASPRFHRSLTEAGLPQPTACLDCHANTRPTTPVMAATFTFDHSTALGECSTCHTSTTRGRAASSTPATARRAGHLPAVPRGRPPHQHRGLGGAVHRQPLRLRHQRQRRDARRRPGLRGLPRRAGHRAVGHQPELAQRPVQPRRRPPSRGTTCIDLPHHAAARPAHAGGRRGLRPRLQRHRRLLRLPPGHRHARHLRGAPADPRRRLARRPELPGRDADQHARPVGAAAVHHAQPHRRAGDRA